MRELQLDLAAGPGRRAALEHALRDAVRDGRLPPASPLPSSRALAADLELSRSTVVSAYEQLTAEGYLVSEHGRGTRVASIRHPDVVPAEPDLLGPSFRWDFRPGEPDASQFPRRRWLRSMRRAVLDGPDSLLTYPDPRGLPALRTTLAGHLARTRSVVVDPAGVFVCGGFASGLGFIADTFRRLGIERVAVEQAMLPFHRAVLRLAGLGVDTIPVDGDGIVVPALDDGAAQAVVVTPANQYPFGVTMSPERRKQLVEWAERRGAWIVEDDYDGEFRYVRKPIGALQGLAPHRVVYAGTASKSLGAGLRLGWLAVPESLRRPLLAAANVRAGVSALDQAALADFIDRGELDRHVRAMRRHYQQRRDELVARLSAEVPSAHVHAPPAGLHLVVDLPSGSVEREIIAEAARRGIGVMGLQSDHGARSDRQALVLGYSRVAAYDWAQGLDLAVGALRDAVG